MYRIAEAKKMLQKIVALGPTGPLGRSMEEDISAVLEVLGQSLSLSTISDEKLAKEINEYVDKFTTDRFPETLPGELAKIMRSIVFDAFTDGARFAEEQHVGEKKSRIILPGN